MVVDVYNYKYCPYSTRSLALPWYTLRILYAGKTVRCDLTLHITCSCVTLATDWWSLPTCIGKFCSSCKQFRCVDRFHELRRTCAECLIKKPVASVSFKNSFKHQVDTTRLCTSCKAHKVPMGYDKKCTRCVHIATPQPLSHD